MLSAGFYRPAAGTRVSMRSPAEHDEGNGGRDLDISERAREQFSADDLVPLQSTARRNN
jgi:hypothetical protein